MIGKHQPTSKIPNQWHADTPFSYACGPYRVIHGIRYWTAWQVGVRRICDASTAIEAMRGVDAQSR